MQVHPAFARQVPEFGRQAVRHVDARVRAGVAQAASRGEARLEREVPARRERIAERSGRKEQVARLRAGAQQRAAVRHGAGAEDVQLQCVAARRISADERHAVLARQCRETFEDAFDARDGGVRRCDEVRERPARLGAHRREIGEYARERLASDEPRIGIRQEVVPLAHGVRLEDEVLAFRPRHKRAVVPRADEHVGARGHRPAHARDQSALAKICESFRNGFCHFRTSGRLPDFRGKVKGISSKPAIGRESFLFCGVCARLRRLRHGRNADDADLRGRRGRVGGAASRRAGATRRGRRPHLRLSRPVARANPQNRGRYFISTATLKKL